MLRLSLGLAVAACLGGGLFGYWFREPVPPRAKAYPAIVSINPCTDAILAEVTVPGQLRAISDYSADPASSSMDLAIARRYPAIGNSVEEVIAMQPDVVVASSFLAPSTRTALEGLGIKVVTVPIASSVAQSEAQVRMLADVAGNRARGQALVARIDRALAAAAPPAGSRKVPALMWETGGIVAGSDTLISELMERTGFSNAATAAGFTQADFVPLEQVLAHPPGVILAQSGPEGVRDRMLDSPVLDELADTPRAQVPGNLLWCGGPTIVRAARRLAAIRRSAPVQALAAGRHP
ncbi:ABC transporter substrate-binding protein [Novosphingobium sp. 9]|uniref:ABC transporter substrate-binding protein n=1 Tax=Novosphingobium sp. 9 TaxID=2025349 RepID=UPI0021B4DB86|nr:helical backbone metal receptor [Novosphingobium sp. 9]